MRFWYAAPATPERIERQGREAREPLQTAESARDTLGIDDEQKRGND